MQAIIAAVECPSLGRKVLIEEIRVSEVRVILAAGEFELDLPGVSFAEAGSRRVLGIAPELLERLSDDDRARIVAVSARLNPDLFNELEGGGAKDEAAPGLTVAALERAVARLIVAGHPNAWDYPWRVFKSAADVLTEDAERD